MSEVATRYIAVPVPTWEPVPERALRATPLINGSAQRGGRAEPETTPSRPVQEHNFHTPSDIAKDALIRFLDLPPNDERHQYDQICEEFVKYLDRCEQKGFMVKGYDTRKGKIINLPMSYENRWGPARRRELSEKLKRLEFWFDMQEDRPVTMITLTSYHEGMTISQQWQELNKHRGKLLKLIAKYFDNPDYFWVPEPHKSGYVHYHLAVFADVSNNVKDNKGKGIEDKFRDLWSRKYKAGNHTYGLDFSHRRGEAKIQHLKNYLSKYLEKGFLLDKWTHGMLLFNAHLWDTGFRMYGASKNIRKMMNIDEEKDSSIVWLETKLETVELTADNEEVEVSEIIWDRDYIPNFIDNSFWTRDSTPLDWEWWAADDEERQRLKKHNLSYCLDTVLAYEPRDKIYHCNWGRPYKGMNFFEQTIAKLPKGPLVSTEEQERRRVQKETESEYNGKVQLYDPVAARRARALAAQEWSD